MTDNYAPYSRYRGLPIRTVENPDGTQTEFIGRRIIPALSRYRALTHYRTAGDERIDTIAAEGFGDPELYWRICDANGDADPATATTPAGRLVVIPLPLEIADDGDA
ncbi:baseplate wedge protein 53 [Sphingopyxis panaciterrae]